MRKQLLHVLIISSVFLSILIAPTTKSLHAEVSVVIKDKDGNQVGMYKGSHALIIGVSDYKAGWPDLESIPTELDDVEDALRKNGFNVERVSNPDSKELEEAFRSFINKYGYDEQNRLLFFFSGHGHTRKKGKIGYLVPVDAPDPRKQKMEFLRKALTMIDILSWSKKMEAKHALFLFDSCFSGTIFKARALPKQPPHISSYTARSVRQFISAGSAGETVPAKSVFTPTFVRALRGKADLNNDNYVTGTELGMYLHDKVLHYRTGQTPQYGKIRDPDLDEGDFVFALNRDVYESPVQMPSEPEDVKTFNYGDIKKRKKKLRDEEEKLAEIKTKWASWQKKLDTAYDEALKYDKDDYLKTSEKAQVWERLVNGFSQDNPYSTEDQLIRSKAMERLKYWKNYREPVPTKENTYVTNQDLDNTDAEGYYFSGIDAIEKNHFHLAVQSFKKAIEIDPTMIKAYIYLGRVYFTKGMIQDAIDAYKKGVELDPANPQSYLYLGIAYRYNDEYELAITELNKAIELNPLSALAYDEIGVTLIKLEKNDEAIAAFENAIAIDPEFPQPHNNLGVIYLMQGKSKDADNEFKKFKELMNAKKERQNDFMKN